LKQGHGEEMKRICISWVAFQYGAIDLSRFGVLPLPE